jgi:hypothetical protein
MSRKNSVVIWLSLTVLVAAVLYIVLSRTEQRYDWSENFRNNQNEPYDLGLLRKAIEAGKNKDQFVVLTSLKFEGKDLPQGTGALFIYIDYNAWLDSAATEHLLEWAKAGNRVFISAGNDHRIFKRLLEPCHTRDTPVLRTTRAKRIYPTTGPGDTTAVVYYNERDEIKRYPWSWYHTMHCERPKVQTSGSFKAINAEYVNYITVPIGKGSISLHCTPLLFTNYHLMREEVLEHAERVLSLKPAQKVVYFDPRAEVNIPPGRPLLSESPLRFILAHPPLRWAWYTLLALVLLFLLTATRRIQRPVPVMAPPPNETLAYIDVVSRMYQKAGGHKHLVNLQYKLLLKHLRMRYGLPPNADSDTYYREAAVRLQLPEADVRGFFNELDRARNNSALSDQDVAQVYQRIKEFHARCP